MLSLVTKLYPKSTPQKNMFEILQISFITRIFLNDQGTCKIDVIVMEIYLFI